MGWVVGAGFPEEVTCKPKPDEWIEAARRGEPLEKTVRVDPQQKTQGPMICRGMSKAGNESKPNPTRGAYRPYEGVEAM